MSDPEHNNSQLTFGGHLEVLRRMLFRILAVTAVLAVTAFVCKDVTWRVLLAPSESGFVTYGLVERAAQAMGLAGFTLGDFHVELIATELSSQFMSHITTACILGLLGASPYILCEVVRFVLPALYEEERRQALPVAAAVYVLFVVGVLMSYFVLFPVSFRFLGTYSVAERVHSTITLDSYVSTFATLTFLLGLVFQLPVLALLLARGGIVTSEMLVAWRKHALLAIVTLAAIITPPDVMTLLLVALPLYLLYEVSIRVVKWAE